MNRKDEEKDKMVENNKTEQNNNESDLEQNNDDKKSDTNEDEKSINDEKEKTAIEEDEEQDVEENDEVAKLQEQIDELNDKYLRLFSEFDNYRKRTLKEKIEHSKMASSEIIAALLPVYDDLARACELANSEEDKESFVKGIKLIHSKFKTILYQKGVEEIPSVGESFNTDFHEAISNVEAKSDEEKGKVVEEIEKGYLLNGKVLRFAKVVVAN